MNINNIKNMDSKQNRHSDVNILATLRMKIYKKSSKNEKDNNKPQELYTPNNDRFRE